jgi:Putative peptidase (DUF1758)
VQVLIEKARKTNPVKEGTLEGMIDFSNCIRNLVSTMEIVKYDGHMRNPQLMGELVSKLPVNLRLKWGKIVMLKPDYTLKDMVEWMEPIARAVSCISIPKITPDAASEDKNRQHGKETRRNDGRGFKDFRKTEAVCAAVTKKGPHCQFCETDGHNLDSCKKFDKETPDGRWQWVMEKRKCMGCLHYGHGIKNCKTKEECGQNGCKAQHHRSLHRELESEKEKTEVVSHASVNVSNHVLLRILPVVLSGPKGKVETFALLDSGSTCSLIEADVAQKIGVTGEVDPLKISGVHGMMSTDYKSERVEFEISGTNEKQVFTMKNVRTVKRLGIPGQTTNIEKWAKKWEHLRNTDIQSLKNATPTVLVGEDHFKLAFISEVIEGPKNAPCLSRTKLGWMLHGNVGEFKDRVDEDFTLYSRNGKTREEIEEEKEEKRQARERREKYNRSKPYLADICRKVRKPRQPDEELVITTSTRRNDAIDSSKSAPDQQKLPTHDNYDVLHVTDGGLNIFMSRKKYEAMKKKAKDKDVKINDSDALDSRDIVDVSRTASTGGSMSSSEQSDKRNKPEKPPKSLVRHLPTTNEDEPTGENGMY